MEPTRCAGGGELRSLPIVHNFGQSYVVPVAKAQGFDTVLVTHLLETKTIQPGEPAVPTVEPPPQNHLRE